MKMILMGLVALSLIGGVGAGGYFYFMKPAEAAITDGEQSKKESKQAEKSDEDDKTAYEFVELDPLILPIIDENGVNQVVSMVIAVEVGSSKGANKVRDLSPRLKDAYIQDMYGMLNKHAALKGGVIQVDMIKKRLNKISNKVLGDDVVKDVLLQVVQQRPI